MSKDRQRVLSRSIELDLWDVFHNRNIDDAKAQLDAVHKVDYGFGEDAKFRVEYGYEYTSVYMDVFRDETDAEYDKRKDKEAAAKEKSRIQREKKKEKARAILMESEAAERAEYERLRAKFEI